MLEKDIILICKGNFDREKYIDAEEALIDYYYKHFSGMDDFVVTKASLINTLLKPVIRYILSKDINESIRFVDYGLFEQSIVEKIDVEHKDFYDVLYERILAFIVNYYGEI